VSPRHRETCFECGRWIGEHGPAIHEGRQRQRSAAFGYGNRCFDCAISHTQRPAGRFALPLDHQPRYCTCVGDVPPPDPNGGCPDCHRLVEALCRCGQSSNT